MSLPPGFRFHPTDEELIGYYLKRKVDGLKIELEVIPEVDLYKFDPWDLPDKSFLTKRDMERFFFCPRDRKYPNGSRTNRATAAGYWKATGKDRKIVCQTSVTGMKKTLVFYRGRAPAGDRTVWVMHEYRLCEEHTQGTYSFHGAFALCRVVKRDEQDHKMGEFHGEPRNQKIVSSSLLNDFTPRAFCDHIARIPEECSSPTIYTTNENHDKAPIPTSQSQTIMEKNLEATPAKVNDSVISDKVLVETAFECLLPNELPSTISIWQPCLNPAVSVHHSSYTSLNQDIDLANDFTAFDYVSPYLRPRIDFEMKLKETVDLPSPEWIEYSCPDQLTNGFEAWNSTPICRQASGDGNIGDLLNLWSQDDNYFQA